MEPKTIEELRIDLRTMFYDLISKRHQCKINLEKDLLSTTIESIQELDNYYKNLPK